MSDYNNEFFNTENNPYYKKWEEAEKIDKLEAENKKLKEKIKEFIHNGS